MSRHNFDYSLPIGREEIDVAITYEFEAGYQGDRVDPPEPASATIVKAELRVDGAKIIAPEFIFAILQRDEDLHSELVHDASNDDSRADDLRDQLREAA